MAFSTADIPRSLRNGARALCEMLEADAKRGVVNWTIDPEECFRDHGFVWAAERLFCSVRVAIDERKGKVHYVSIELPEEFEGCACGGTMPQEHDTECTEFGA